MDIIELVDSMLNVRTKRRNEVEHKLNIDIAQIENIYETMEGSARYVEYSLYKLFSHGVTNTNIVDSDTAFHQYDDFENFDVADEKWFYLTENTTYYYATGFNIVRLLEKLDIEYKTRLFHEKELTLEGVLMEYRNRRQKHKD